MRICECWLISLEAESISDAAARDRRARYRADASDDLLKRRGQKEEDIPREYLEFHLFTEEEAKKDNYAGGFTLCGRDYTKRYQLKNENRTVDLPCIKTDELDFLTGTVCEDCDGVYGNFCRSGRRSELW